MKRFILSLTISGLIFAILACYFLLKESHLLAFVLILFAMVFDMLDGPLARKAQVVSQSGKWLDTISDVFIYLLFPAIYWQQTHDLLVAVLIVFILTGCFRLIRFTLHGFAQDKGQLSYVGMPVFYSQFLLFFTLLMTFNKVLLETILVLVSLLMISKIKFIKIPPKLLSVGLILYAFLIVWKFTHAS